jgi:uncharacterized membrane protein
MKDGRWVYVVTLVVAVIGFMIVLVATDNVALAVRDGAKFAKWVAAAILAGAILVLIGSSLFGRNRAGEPDSEDESTDEKR